MTSCQPRETEVKRKYGKSVPVYHWDDFLALADKVTESELDERLSKIKPGHACTIIYTSGTTGNPKAVMVSHDNIAFEASSVLTMVADDVEINKEEEGRILSYVPPSRLVSVATAHLEHYLCAPWIETSMEMACMVVCGMASGVCLRATGPSVDHV